MDRIRWIRTDLAHRIAVKLEVAGVGRISVGVRQTFVGFLAHDDLVHEEPHGRTAYRCPGNRCRGDAHLEVLQQGHEVPDRIDVMGHEQAQIIERLYTSVQRVAVELVGEPGYDLGIHGVGNVHKH